MSTLLEWGPEQMVHFSSRMLGARRLGKLATFVLYMAEDTDLVGASISNYVWAFRSWRIFPFSSPSLPLPLPLPLPLLYLRRVHWILEECTGLREGKNLSLTQGYGQLNTPVPPLRRALRERSRLPLRWVHRIAPSTRHAE